MKPGALVLAACLAACSGASTPAGMTSTTSNGPTTDRVPNGTVAGSSLTVPDPFTFADDVVAYADAHWDDGEGLCAEFTTRSLRAGKLSIDLLTWVPDVVAALAGVAYTEFDPSDPADVGGEPGDIVIYSDANGSEFCINHDNDAFNCGHAGVLVVTGTDGDSARADFHNNAHQHMPINYILDGDYTSYRVYHLSAAIDGCSADTDCNGGRTGTGHICSDDARCIDGCRTDADCAAGTTCSKPICD